MRERIWSDSLLGGKRRLEAHTCRGAYSVCCHEHLWCLNIRTAGEGSWSATTISHPARRRQPELSQNINHGRKTHHRNNSRRSSAKTKGGIRQQQQYDRIGRIRKTSNTKNITHTHAHPIAIAIARAMCRHHARNNIRQKNLPIKDFS